VKGAEEKGSEAKYEEVLNGRALGKFKDERLLIVQGRDPHRSHLKSLI